MHTERPPRAKTGMDKIEVWRKKGEEFLKSHQTVESCLDAFRNKNEGPRTRIFGLMAAAVRLFGAGDAVLKKMERTYDFSKIPINPDLYELKEDQLGSGYWSEVYMLKPKQGNRAQLVFKVEFPHKKHSVEQLAEIVRHYRNEYQFLKDAYKEIEGVIPESNYFVTESPRTGKPAIAVLQTFVGEQAFDLLSADSIGRVRELFAEDAAFKHDFEIFRDITLRLWDAHKNPDLAGANNILVVQEGGRHCIRIVDHHSVDANNAIAQEWQRRAVERLRAV